MSNKMVVLFLILAVSTSMVQSQNLFQWSVIYTARGICQVKTMASNEVIQQVRAWNFSSTDRRLKEYIYCVYHFLRLMNDEAEIDVQKAKSLLPPQTDFETFSKAVTFCSTQTGTNVADKAYNTLKCYNEQYPKDIIAL